MEATNTCDEAVPSSEPATYVERRRASGLVYRSYWNHERLDSDAPVSSGPAAADGPLVPYDDELHNATTRPIDVVALRKEVERAAEESVVVAPRASELPDEDHASGTVLMRPSRLAGATTQPMLARPPEHAALMARASSWPPLAAPRPPLPSTMPPSTYLAPLALAAQRRWSRARKVAFALVAVVLHVAVGAAAMTIAKHVGKSAAFLPYRTVGR